MGHDAICLIPARGGSKRIPRKNSRLFCGRPMIAWAISAALDSGVFDRVIVSTDDREIAAVSVKAGAEVPFIRSAELAGDHVGLIEVIRHAVDWLGLHGEKPQLFACVYATAAFLSSSDLANAMERLKLHKSAEFIISVGTYPASPFQAMSETVGDRLKFQWPEFAHARTQDLPDTFYDAAQFLIGKREAFSNYSNALGGLTIPYALPRILCQDIDTPEDWDQAVALFKFLKTKKGVGRR